MLHQDDLIAVIADIHGNVWALEAVIRDARKKNITRFINLGDILYGPLAPQKTYEILRENNWVTIQGNEDRLICESRNKTILNNPTLSFVLEDLEPEAIQWIKSLPRTTVSDDKIFLCHGTPDDDLCYLLEDVSNGFPIVRKDKNILNLLGNTSHPIVLCGHSHIPRLTLLSSNQIVVNPGSVGLQAYIDDFPVFHEMKTFSPFASYTVLQQNNNGLDFEFVRVLYDTRPAIKKARDLGRMDWAHALATGRVLSG